MTEHATAFFFLQTIFLIFAALNIVRTLLRYENEVSLLKQRVLHLEAEWKAEQYWNEFDPEDEEEELDYEQW